MKFDMNAAWRDATAMISANREVLLIVAGIFFFLPSVATGFALGDVRQAAMADPQNAEAAIMEIYGRWWWLLLGVAIVSVVGTLTLVALLRSRDRPTVGEAIRAGLSGLPSALGASLIAAFALAIPLSILLAVAAGSPLASALVELVALLMLIFAFVRFALVSPVIAVDKVYNPLKALGLSWRMTRGNSLRLFFFYVLLAAAYLVCAIVVGLAIGLLMLVAGSAVGVIVDAVVSGLVTALASVILIAVLAAVHRQLSGGAQPVSTGPNG